MSQKVGGVLIDIATNFARVQKEFGEINKTIKKFSYQAKRDLKSIALNLGLAFGVRQIKRFITEGVGAIDTMQDMAQSAGMSTRKLQGWIQAASYAGVEASGVAKALKRLNINILDANYGLGEAKRIFHDVGVEFETTTGEMRDTGPVFEEITDEFAKMGDRSRKAGLANKLFGRSGAALIPVMNLTSAGIEKVTKNLEKWGALVTDDTMAIMDEVNRNFKDMGAGLRGIKLQVLAGMAEELQQLSTAWVNNQEALSNFVKVGDLLGKTLVYIAVGAAAIAATTESLGTFFGMMAAAGDYMFFPENLEEVGAKIEGILYKWNNFMQDLMKPITLNLDLKKKGQGIAGINKLLEDNRQIVSKALKEYKGIINLKADEHNQLLRIYTILSKQVSLTIEHDEILKAIGKRMEKIRAEHERLLTDDVWGNMKIGFSDYADSIMDRNKQIQEAVVDSMKTMEDALVDFVVKGKLEWASLRDAILSDIARIIIRQHLMAPFARLVGGLGATSPTPYKVPIGSGGNVIPAPIPTTPTARGRRARVADTTINLSNDVQNIVKENTYLMNRDVEDFVKNSESQFRRMGRTLKRSLSSDDMGTGGILGGPLGYSTPSGGPIVSPTGGGAGGGVSTSGIAVSGGLDIGVGSEIEAIQAAIKDPTGTNILEALKETHILKIVAQWTADAIEHIYDDVFGKGAADALVDSITDAVKTNTPINTLLNPASVVGDIVGGDAGEVIEKILDPTSWFRKRGTSDTAGGGITINVPVTIESGDSLLASELRVEIEKTVIEVMRKYA